MGIQVDFNPDLALRNILEFKSGNRKEEECVPENLKAGEIYDFLKKGKSGVSHLLSVAAGCRHRKNVDSWV